MVVDLKSRSWPTCCPWILDLAACCTFIGNPLVHADPSKTRCRVQPKPIWSCLVVHRFGDTRMHACPCHKQGTTRDAAAAWACTSRLSLQSFDRPMARGLRRSIPVFQAPVPIGALSSSDFDGPNMKDLLKRPRKGSLVHTTRSSRVVQAMCEPRVEVPSPKTARILT
jgi:hypothetical protein